MFLSLYNIGKYAPGLRVTYFNLIGREMERSVFSWKSLFIFLQRIFFTGEVRIPLAVILGTVLCTRDYSYLRLYIYLYIAPLIKVYIYLYVMIFRYFGVYLIRNLG